MSFEPILEGKSTGNISKCVDYSLNNGLDLQFGYHYENIIAGASHIEFHVNYWNRFSATTEAGSRTDTRTNTEHPSVIAIKVYHDNSPG